MSSTSWPELDEQRARLVVRRHALGVDVGHGDDRRRVAPDAQPARVAAGRGEERLAGRQRRRGERVVGERARHHVEQRGGVADRAREHPLVRQLADRVAQRSVADAAACRLDADEPGDARRDADRPAAVRPVAGAGQPGGDRGCGTAARPARPARQVPRRTGRRCDRGLGVAGQAELRRVRLAGDDQAALLHPRDDVVVAVRRHVVGDRAEGAAHTGHEHEVLRRHDRAVQDAERLVGIGVGHLLVGGAGHVAREVVGARDERADRVAVASVRAM